MFAFVDAELPLKSRLSIGGFAIRERKVPRSLCWLGSLTADKQREIADSLAGARSHRPNANF
jgi:hypothetical protein